jgi:hypothetical protein
MREKYFENCVNGKELQDMFGNTMVSHGITNDDWSHKRAKKNQKEPDQDGPMILVVTCTKLDPTPINIRFVFSKSQTALGYSGARDDGFCDPSSHLSMNHSV